MSAGPIIPSGYVSTLFSLEGRVAAVTGGASGLGVAMAAGLAQAGAEIAVLDVREDAAAAAAAAIERDGGRAVPMAVDVTDRTAVDAVADRVVRELGRVDILVNSAGTAFRSPAEDFPEEEFDRIIALNLKGTYLPCQAFGRKLLAAGKGSIVNVASIGGFIAYPHASAYLSSKGGVVQLTRGLALEWVSRGVRVNAIAPTLFRTPLTEKVGKVSSVTSDFIVARLPRERRLGEPHEVVGAAIFLASDASALVTGHTLPVDDGYLIA
ncbi:MAG: glucose 1-dehydrogenase [Actinobacteria bacterium]|nr:glucose 1-dehydrogenase [Actinomycetota bacterium]